MFCGSGPSIGTCCSPGPVLVLLDLNTPDVVDVCVGQLQDTSNEIQWREVWTLQRIANGDVKWSKRSKSDCHQGFCVFARLISYTKGFNPQPQGVQSASESLPQVRIERCCTYSKKLREQPAVPCEDDSVGEALGGFGTIAWPWPPAFELHRVRSDVGSRGSCAAERLFGNVQ